MPLLICAGSPPHTTFPWGMHMYLTVPALTDRNGKGAFGSKCRGSEKRIRLEPNNTDQCKMLLVSEKDANSNI